MVPRSVIVALLFATAFAHFETEGSGSGEFGSGDNVIAHDQVPIDTDCSNKEDGLYEIAACSPQFLTCSGGVDRIMDCPSNLIYDSRIVACEYPAAVPGCPGFSTEEPETTEQPSTTTTEATTTVVAYEVPTFSQEPESSSHRSAVDRTCSEDGFFSYGECSDSYTACTNGRSIPMMCPSNLAFDEARQICDYPLAVPECTNHSGDDEGSSGEETTTSEYESSGEQTVGYGYYESSSTEADVPSTTEYYTPENQSYGSVEPVEPAADEPTRQPSCVEGATQIEPCSQNYKNCIDGQEALFTCESGLYFSAEQSTCLPAEQLPECQAY